jgi:fibro-slime domain-containing protein
MVYLVAFALLLALCSADDAQTGHVLELEATVYDFSRNAPNAFADFYDQDRKGGPGMVKNTLDPVTKVPELVLPGNSAPHWGVTDFSKWFQPSELSKEIPVRLKLKSLGLRLHQYDSKTDGVSNTFTFDYTGYPLNPPIGKVDKWFLPIEGQGWGNEARPGRKWNSNYGFSMKLNTNFFFRGTETFFLQGDDDLWVFVNNKLAVDLGGTHMPKSKLLDMSDVETQAKLGITPGNSYDLDFYMCERNQHGSTLVIQTTILLCPADACNDNNSCTADVCREEGDCWRCEHQPVHCDDGDKCTADSCDAATGQCKFEPLCDDGKPCTSKQCLPEGNPGKCDENGVCQPASPLCVYRPLCTEECKSFCPLCCW